jgi:3-phosphoshikimate 1-carboxyvinyltransferase
LLASLNTKGETIIIENKITRDHTEIMLESFGAQIDVRKKNNNKLIKIIGKKELVSKNIDVPNDLSSSAFFIVSALINNNSKVVLKNINNNPTRNGLLIALEKMGAKIKLLNKRISNNENICDIEVLSSNLNGCELGPEIADLMIDEYPILAVAASFASTPSIFRGLKELRVKESDRLKLIMLNLQKCGVNCKTENDDLFIYPSKNYEINSNIIQTDFDHRIAMAFCIMGTRLGPLRINDSESINTSFPNFKNELNKLGGKII